MGAFTPEMRESDDEVVRRGAVFVDTFEGALAEAGDILQAIASGAPARERIESDLFGLCAGRRGGTAGSWVDPAGQAQTDAVSPDARR